MPLSRPDTVPRVINTLWDSNVHSLLDVGVGFGAMGVLIRQIMDVRWGRIRQSEWQGKLYGIEINPRYRNPAWEVYDKVIVGDAREIIDTVGSFDAIFFGDILEHFEKEEALKLMEKARKKAHVVIITTPASFAGNEAEAERFDNPNEAHKCLIEASDFENARVEIYGNQQFILLS